MYRIALLFALLATAMAFSPSGRMAKSSLKMSEMVGASTEVIEPRQRYLLGCSLPFRLSLSHFCAIISRVGKQWRGLRPLGHAKAP